MAGDVEMDDANVSAQAATPLPPLRLSDEEMRILDLYDKLKDLQLEIALLKARQQYIPGRY